MLAGGGRRTGRDSDRCDRQRENRYVHSKERKGEREEREKEKTMAFGFPSLGKVVQTN